MRKRYCLPFSLYISPFLSIFTSIPVFSALAVYQRCLRWLSIYTSSYGIFTSIITLSIDLYRFTSSITVYLIYRVTVITTTIYTSANTVPIDDNTVLRRILGGTVIFWLIPFVFYLFATSGLSSCCTSLLLVYQHILPLLPMVYSSKHCEL